jgi:hypothetical protein
MSFLGRIFNEKGQQSKTHAHGRKPTFFNMEEEDREEEDTKSTEVTSGDNAVNQEDQETYEILEREIHPAKIICPDCGGITLEGLEFCDKCGGEL